MMADNGMTRLGNMWRGNEGGRTLLELAVAILIGGILLVAAIQIYVVETEQKRYDTARLRLDAVESAIAQYVTLNGFLPCAAPAAPAMDDPAFGVAADCAVAAPAGVTAVAGASGGNIWIGMVPVRTLNLPDSYAVDPWGGRVTYAVTTEMARDAAEFRASRGAISVVDSNGQSLTNPVDTAIYVLASHGANGAGARSENTGAIARVCPAAAVTESENCDGDNRFARTLLRGDAGNNGDFDDHVRYGIKDFMQVSAINRYIVDRFPCTAVGPGSNTLGENCASVAVSGTDVYIDHAAGDTPDDGALMYRRTFTSETDGRLVVRATIPATYDNTGPGKWEQALHAAIYVNGVLQAEGMIIDPATTLEESEGRSGLMIGSFDGIVAENDYTVEIYLYSYGNQAVGNVSAWAGAIRHTDHSTDAVVEIMELANL